MKIALLNLPFDNNYGGNLQRYALVRVLQGMGHEVEHINLQFYYSLPWYKWAYSYPKRMIKKYIFKKKGVCVFTEKKTRLEMAKKLALTNIFYEKYIPHTPAFTNIKQIKEYTYGKYDAYLVGSDQVWRKGLTGQIGLKNYLLNFTHNENVKRFAYAISFGVSGNLLNKKEIAALTADYSKFDAVSVREHSALDLLNEYGWNQPKPCLCLDPTLLLTQQDYISLINENDVKDLTSGKIFTYILDVTEKTQFVTNCYSSQYKKEIINVGLGNTSNVSICQWLNNIRCADLVITDSYHGCVFSIIFNRPFVFLGNKGRGNSRIDSLFNLFDIQSNETEMVNYEKLNKKIEKLKMNSMEFINKIS